MYHILRDNFYKRNIVGRWGGEEFIILMPETNIDDTYMKAEELKDIINNYHFEHVGHKTASFGVATYNKNYTLKQLIKDVDDALYQAKENGRNRVEKLS
ncbi:MAG: GGDEF domain-containing protein [Clostridiales bacterium]|nr:GGDEF domain-containing protein [Clostridiales bacterium]